MILHITTRTAWESAGSAGVFRPDSLDTDGFIHCSTPIQVLMPANAIFRGQVDLVLLCIDPAEVQSPIVYEDLYETGHDCPHIYGPLNLEAVIKAIDFPPNRDGTFGLPSEVVHLASQRKFHPNYPILQYDPAREAIIEPRRILAPIDISAHCVMVFFQDVITDLNAAGKLRLLYTLGSEVGPNPVYELEIDGRRLALTHAGVGASMSAAFLEELIALGCRKFIACGGCGVLEHNIGVGQVIVPEAAVRDEGTSYHYLPPARDVHASPEAVSAIKKTLIRHHVDYVVGRTWTTDGIYRETEARMAWRQAEGCLAVEMEAAAFFAVAQFRGVTFGQILYGGDDLAGDKWDNRDWQRMTSAREKLFWLAAEACLEL